MSLPCSSLIQQPNIRDQTSQIFTMKTPLLIALMGGSLWALAARLRNHHSGTAAITPDEPREVYSNGASDHTDTVKRAQSDINKIIIILTADEIEDEAGAGSVKLVSTYADDVLVALPWSNLYLEASAPSKPT
ncbi:uncharacterized protein AB675_4112 [Cyphellophora attinorum]|uniref:Uncharacterized protein n=1 Tax=Cyphellophora attinorum TaxID=1664694 RepID=A0A0N1H229_9EURO|nr:uncharacterized protein AB675_4112 [Phialophora attinorum]KPI38606.1 hypothetical protein AB675_4112 [Phialophora attinorum]